MIRVEMHCHTTYSPDGFINEQQLLTRCMKMGIDCICIVDHNTIQGALEFARKLPIRVIPGEEIETQKGEIIGLFLKKEIGPSLSLEQTVEKIREQEGIVYVPHPFDEFRDSSVKLEDAEKIKGNIDVIEVFNSRTFNEKYNRMAVEFARRNNLTVSVGSDAHHRFEVGQSYVEMDDFSDKESFLENLKCARHITKKCLFAVRLYIKGLKILTGKK